MCFLPLKLWWSKVNATTDGWEIEKKGSRFAPVSIVRDIGVVMGFSAWHSEDALLPEFALSHAIRQEHLRLREPPWKLLEMTVVGVNHGVQATANQGYRWAD